MYQISVAFSLSIVTASCLDFVCRYVLINAPPKSMTRMTESPSPPSTDCLQLQSDYKLELLSDLTPQSDRAAMHIYEVYLS